MGGMYELPTAVVAVLSCQGLIQSLFYCLSFDHSNTILDLSLFRMQDKFQD